jgi:hypothetical protein
MQIRVLHKPMVCKALINCHEGPIVDHSLQVTRLLTEDTEQGPVVVSLDRTGLLVISAFETPASSEQNLRGKLMQRTQLKIKFVDGSMPDEAAKVALGQPTGIVEVGNGYVYVAIGCTLLCINVAQVQAAFADETVLASLDRLPHGTPQLKHVSLCDVLLLSFHKRHANEPSRTHSNRSVDFFEEFESCTDTLVTKTCWTIL